MIWRVFCFRNKNNISCLTNSTGITIKRAKDREANMVSRMMFLMSILGSLVIFPSTAAAQASCWGYIDEQGRCVGCNEPYFYSLCTTGCVHGYCISHGGSGQCSCGFVYYSAVIYSDGGDCSGDNCSLARVRVSHLAQNSKEHNTHVQEGTNSPRRVPRLLFVLNPCEHSFQLIQRDIAPLAGGM